MDINPYHTINSTPKKIEVVYLLDILFLLLILFMIYAINSKPSHSIVLDLPRSNNGVTHNKKHHSISIKKSKLYVNKLLCDHPVLSCLKAQGIQPKELLIVNASKSISLQKFMSFMDQLQSNKYQNIEVEVDQF
jgi:biopolymer transport protein ExbD